MSQKSWNEVEQYIVDKLVPGDQVLEETLASSDAADLPTIQISPNEGMLLALLATMQGASSILEIGTLGGYSTIWLARALPAGGKMITLESEAKHAEIARANIARAELSDIVDLRVGPALESLPHIAAEGVGPFDLIFLDADKPNNPAYFEWALRLSAKGTLIIADNVVRRGAVLDEHSDDPTIRGIRQFYEMVAAEPRVRATAIQTVGSKGHDGIAFALVIADPV